MNYKNKRKKVKLSAYTVAKELGVDFDKYKLVEEGKISLEKDLLDKFLEITQPEKAKEINFNRMQRLGDIKNFARAGNIPRLMKDRKYPTQKTLADAMGLTITAVNNVVNYNDNVKISDDKLEMVYDFLMDPMNTYVEKKDTNYMNRHEIPIVSSKEEAEAAGLLEYRIRWIDENETLEEKLNNCVELPIKIDGLKFEDEGKDDAVDALSYYTYKLSDNEKDYIENDIDIIKKAEQLIPHRLGANICDIERDLYETKHNLYEAEKKIERYEKIIDRLLKEGE